MLCDRILGTLSENATTPPTDFIEVTWAECGKRALRKHTNTGRELKVLLPLGTVLQHGDVLGDAEAEHRVAVNVLPCDVLVIKPLDVQTMAVLALEVGNLHAPAEVTADGELIVLPDGPIEALLERMRVPYEAQVRRFSPLRISSMSIAVAESLEVQRR